MNDQIMDAVGIMAGCSRVREEWERAERRSELAVLLFLAVGFIGWLIV